MWTFHLIQSNSQHITGIVTNLDRFLMASVFTSTLSDHTPIIIKFQPKNVQQKGTPFRYNNEWYFIAGYEEQVVSVLSDLV